jgi:hypothetical protein
MDLEFVVFESTDSGATWTRIDANLRPLLGPGRWVYRTTAGRGIRLEAGRRYAFMTFYCQSATYHDEQLGPGHTTSFALIGLGAGGIPAGVRYTSSCVPPPTPTLEPNGDNLVHTVFCEVGGTCSISRPAMGTSVSGLVTLEHEVDHLMSLPVSALYEYSTNAGTSWVACTPAMGLNPVPGIPTPSTGIQFEWNSVADGVGVFAPQTAALRVSVDDGSSVGTCLTTGLLVDNTVPLPSCTVSLVGTGPVQGTGSFQLLADSPSSAMVTARVSYSTDGGTLFLTATPAPGSSNPMLGIPILVPALFEWDSRADGVALSGALTGVLVRVSVENGIAPLGGSCLTAPFAVDNTSLCTRICGDCSEDGLGPDVIDALVAAQIAAGLTLPTANQMACCDANASLNVDVVDALLLAQEATGLLPGLVCP